MLPRHPDPDVHAWCDRYAHTRAIALTHRDPGADCYGIASTYRHTYDREYAFARIVADTGPDADTRDADPDLYPNP
ncbi:MAG: hypothetical protein HKN01_01430 [Acidimicrobiia bacterium]|nr:hypothetical protein [Acidimicrobiia bacterium]